MTYRHCRRCGDQMKSEVSDVCERCWEDMGQMHFGDEEEDQYSEPSERG